MLGHEEVLRSQKNVCELEQQWTHEYGTVFRVGGFYGVRSASYRRVHCQVCTNSHRQHDTILVSDAKALQHIFTTADRYPKGADEERFAHAVFGPGLVTVSGTLFGALYGTVGLKMVTY